MAGQPNVDISLVLAIFLVAGLALVWLAGWAGFLVCWLAGWLAWRNRETFFKKCCFFIGFSNFFGGWAGWLAGLAGWLSGWLAGWPGGIRKHEQPNVDFSMVLATFLQYFLPGHHSIFKNVAFFCSLAGWLAWDTQIPGGGKC